MGHFKAAYVVDGRPAMSGGWNVTTRNGQVATLLAERLSGSVQPIDGGWRVDLARDEVLILLDAENGIRLKPAAASPNRSSCPPGSLIIQFVLPGMSGIGMFELRTASHEALRSATNTMTKMSARRTERFVRCRLRLVRVDHRGRDAVISCYRYPSIELEVSAASGRDMDTLNRGPLANGGRCGALAAGPHVRRLDR
ncbi:hypothetical protein [Streptomyces sp. N35]|uniref:recombination directionality factor n=1 Tax=Streptomyces sp. N35 TaxID=2795730 RepID=UPI0018F3E232|nr:hypothetical protein [Streptomyces sp. N35]